MIPSFAFEIMDMSYYVVAVNDVSRLKDTASCMGAGSGLAVVIQTIKVDPPR